MSSPAPPLSLLAVPPRQKLQKPAPIGITAGAEDAKYHAKYKELKRKVKDIEADNDKLHFKVLQAKLSIRRTKMERAVLYERLSVVPPSPNLQDRLALPPANRPARPPSPADRAPIDNNNNSAVPLSSPRRISAHHHPYPQHLPPMASVHHHHPYENSRGHPSHASPPVHHANTSHHNHARTRSQSSSHSRSQHPPQPYPHGGGGGQLHHYPESLPSVQQPLHSPPLSEHERPRREQQQLYPHDYLGGNSHADPHHLAHAAAAPYDYELRHNNNNPGSSTTHHLHYDSPRTSSRIHAHQRLAPGTYVNSRDGPGSRILHHEAAAARDLPGRDREREQHEMLLERERERELVERDIDREYRERDRERDRRFNRGNMHPTSAAAQHSPPHSHSHQHHLSSHQHQHRYTDRSPAQIDYAHEYPHGHPHTGSAPPLSMSSSSRSRGGADRDEPPYRDYHDTAAPTHTHSTYPLPPPTRISRSGTPGSGSISAASGTGGAPPIAEGPSRPDSRSQYYGGDEREREYPSSMNRSSYSRQVRSGGRGGGGEGDADFDLDAHAEEGRSSRGDHHPGSATATTAGPPTPSGGGGINNSNNNSAAPHTGGSATSLGNNFPLPKSRKRNRNDMEVVDSDNDVGDNNGQPPGTAAVYSSRQQEDSRSSKRYHRELSRSVDNVSTHEDSRMGPL